MYSTLKYYYKIIYIKFINILFYLKSYILYILYTLYHRIGKFYHLYKTNKKDNNKIFDLRHYFLKNI